MRVGCEDDRGWLAAPQFGSDMRLRLGPDFAHHAVPLIVGQARGVLPAFDLPVEGSVGPKMVAVRSEVQPARRGSEAPGK